MKNNTILKSLLISAAIAVAIPFNPANAQENASGFSWQNLPKAQLPMFKIDTFNIAKYGAKPAEMKLNTEIINKVINDCSMHGGGVVMIPAGAWITGPVVLKSKVNLYLAKGSVLVFTSDKDQYPLVKGNFEGLVTYRNQPPVSGTDLENIAITGSGIIDGNGDAWRALGIAQAPATIWAERVNSGGVLSDDGKSWFPSAQFKKGQDLSKKGVIDKFTTISEFASVKDFLRPNLVVVTNCKQVLLEGVTFQNSPAWCIHPLMCSDLTIKRITVKNPEWAQNGDGIDIESCKNVVLANSVFDCGDDGICIKSGKDEQGRKRGMPTENVTIHDDTVYHAHGGFVIGSEMSGGAKNIYAYHCTFIGTAKGLRFKTARGRGGLVSNIYVKDIYMKNIIQEAILFDMYYFTKPPRAGEAAPVFAVNETTPRFQDFYISDVRCEGAEKGIFVRGLPEMSIKNINFQNIDLKAKTAVEIIEADGIHLKNIQLNASHTNPVVFIENSSNVTFNDLDAGQKSDVMFSIAGERSKNISASDIKTKKVTDMARFTNHADKTVLTIQ
jgi:polygalacturonase